MAAVSEWSPSLRTSFRNMEIIMDSHHPVRTSQRGCSLSEERAAYSAIGRRIASYRGRDVDPPAHLEAQRRELRDHFAAISQGR